MDKVTTKRLRRLFAALIALGMGLSGLLYLYVEFVGAPNFNARRLSEMRSEILVIRDYYERCGKYPAMVPLDESKLDRYHKRYLNGLRLMVADLSDTESLQRFRASHRLNDPVAYILADWGFLVYTTGPDERYQLSPTETFLHQPVVPAAQLSAFTYDPTNGVVSSGDLIRIEPRARPDGAGSSGAQMKRTRTE